jgi:1,2-diacylglycerol 3-beta-glucosyltransferase
MSTKKILLVEDEGMIALDLRRILENFGYEVPYIASRGEEAVKETAKIRPDLVLMDITLKGTMNGIEAAKKILTLNIPVVYLTGASDNKTLKKATEIPVYGFIVKPYIEQELITTIEIALNKHQLDLAKIEKFKQDLIFKRDKIQTSNINCHVNRSKPHILVVEDQNITAMDIAGKLDDLGYNVTGTVSSGCDAIEKARELNPDLILMDIILKGNLDGIDVSKSIEDLNIPVVFLTSYADKLTLKKAQETSPYGYIIKPYGENELKTTIEMALHKHQRNQEEIKSEVGLLTTKLTELKIGRIGVIITTTSIIVLMVYGFITRNMTWLEFLLFFSGFYGLILALSSFLKSSKPSKADLKLPVLKPFVTILVPAHNEENTIENCVKSLINLDYNVDGIKNYEIIVIDDGSTDNTPSILNKIEGKYDFFKVMTRKLPLAGKGKGYVLNDGLKLAKGEIIAVFDADALVEPDFMNMIIPYMDEEGVAGVQGRVKMYNKDENLLTALQHIEFSIYGEVLLKARDKIDGAAFLGGNGQITRKDVITEYNGWDGYALTEDLNISVKLMINGWKIRYCGDAVVNQEAVKDWRPFFRQRTRWAMGNMETLFVYFKSIILSDISLIKKIDSIYYLSTILCNGFVMMGYMVFILYFANIQFSLTAPIIIVLLSTLAFFPVVISGVWKDSKNIKTTVVKSIEYWLHCFYIIPLFISTFINLLTRKDSKWDKTYHTGETKILENKKSINQNPHDLLNKNFDNLDKSSK